MRTRSQVTDPEVARLEADFFRRGEELGGDETEPVGGKAPPPREETPALPPLSGVPALFARPSARKPPTSPRPPAPRSSTRGGRLFVIGTVLLFLFTLAGALVFGARDDDAAREGVAGLTTAATGAAAMRSAEAKIRAESSSAGERAAAARSRRGKAKRASKHGRQKRSGRRPAER